MGLFCVSVLYCRNWASGGSTVRLSFSFRYKYVGKERRIRIKAEEVVAAVWGTELIQFLAALSICARMIEE